MSAVGNATAPMWTTMSFVYSLSMGASILISQSVGEKDIEKAKNYAASMIKCHNVIPLLLFLFWTFCSPLVFKLMGVSENVMSLCITYTRIYAPVYLIIGLGASYSVVFQTSNYTKPLVAYGIIRSSKKNAVNKHLNLSNQIAQHDWNKYFYEFVFVFCFEKHINLPEKIIIKNIDMMNT